MLPQESSTQAVVDWRLEGVGSMGPRAGGSHSPGSPTMAAVRVYRMTPEDWQRHVANNHVPYSRDCAVCVCVHNAGTDQRHAGIAHPDVCCMNADVAGPLRVRGRDPESRNHCPATFKHFLAVSSPFPKLKGAKEESNPDAAEGFDDPAGFFGRDG